MRPVTPHYNQRGSDLKLNVTLLNAYVVKFSASLDLRLLKTLS